MSDSTAPTGPAAPAGATRPVPTDAAGAAIRARGIVAALLAPYPIAFLALVVGTAYLANAYRIGALAFNTQAFLNVAQVFAPLVLVAAFVERATEVVMTGLRGGESDQLEADLDAATAAAQAAPSPESAAAVRALQRRLLAFKSTSREVAFLLASGLGIGAALCGIRGLAGLLAPTQAQPPSPSFNLLDILLTGLVIGGGADGIHKMVQAILGFVQGLPTGKSS